MSNTIIQIKDIITNFCNENLNAEFEKKSIETLAQVENTNAQILSTSRVDIWAASILSVVLEENGVFNKKHEMYTTKKDFSKNIGVSAGTIKNKADLIKEMLQSNEDETTNEVLAQSEVALTTEVVENENEKMYQEFMKIAHESNEYEVKIENFEKAIKVAVDMIEDKGEALYWEDEITRSYMIALQDLGNLFDDNKDFESAKKVYELLLNLNPTDHQGIRYKLINILISQNKRKEINDLFVTYKDDKSSSWLYSKVLYYYKNNNMFMAKDALKEAVERNKYISLKLIKWTAFMQMSGVYIDPVLFDEANYYCEESIDLWKKTKGSIDWLLKNVLKK